MHKHTAWEGEHLCLVLHASEWSRENQAVVITLEFGAVVVALGVMILLSESLIGYKLFPVHIQNFVQIYSFFS